MATAAAGRVGEDQQWRRWRSRWTLLCLPVACMVVVWGSMPVLSLSLLPGLLGGIGQTVLLTNIQGKVSDSYVLRTLVATTLFSWILAIALLSVGSIATSAAMLMLVMVGFTAPPGARAAGHFLDPPDVEPEVQRKDPTSLSADPVLSRVELPPVAQMSDVELCLAWRRSFVALANAATLERRLSLVQLRQSYLDELDKRDECALRAWLAAGARAASGPERYLT